MSQEELPSSNWLWIIFVVVLVIGAGFFGWQYWQKNMVKSAIQPVVTIDPNSLPQVTPKTLKSYSNSAYNFSLKYPSDWTYAETNNPGLPDWAQDVNFKNASNQSVFSVAISNELKTIALNAPDGVDLTAAQAAGVETKIGDQAAKKYGDLIYVTSFGKRVYQIVGDTALSTADLNQIVTSFKFSNPSTDLKITKRVPEGTQNMASDVVTPIGVPVDKVELVFNNPLDITTVTTKNFCILSGESDGCTGADPAKVTYDKTTNKVTITPNQKYIPDTNLNRYTVLVQNVKDVKGNILNSYSYNLDLQK